MGKIKSPHLSWKPVELNEAVLKSGVEGLVGIEELTDYQLENDELSTKKSKLSMKKMKNVQSTGLKNKTLNISKSKKPVFSIKKAKKSKSKSPSKTLNNKLSNKKIQLTLATSDGSEDENESNSDEESSSIADISDTTEASNGTNIEDFLPWTLLGTPTEVAKALLDQGFKEPTEIQRLCILPAIKGRRDILGAAETGSGKTLAFGIPIIHGILNNTQNGPNMEEPEENDDSSESDKEDMSNNGIGCVRVVNLGKVEVPQSSNKLWAVILTPTRELAVQVKNHLVAALKYTSIQVVVVVGGMAIEKQQRLLRRQPEIVVATPGRLWELISQGEPHLNTIQDIRYLAIDETDRMTEVNHFPELRMLMEKINADPEKQKKRQNFVFSATLTLIHDLPIHTKIKNKKKKNLILSSDSKLKKLINILGITSPKIVDVTNKTGTAEKLTESAIVCSLTQKDYYLYYFLQRHPGRSLVFCNSISCVRRLASLLSVLGVRPLPLHANMIQKQRLKNLDKFRDSSEAVLLATDVAARGLDIPHVQHVIHYQVPRTSETYVHRSGRTARASQEGLTLLLVETSEQHQYMRLMRTLNREKELPRFPIVSSLLEVVKRRVDVARDIDALQLELKKAVGRVNWVELAAKEMDIVLDDDQLPVKVNDRTVAVIKRQIQAKQKQLKSLLKQTLAPKKVSYRFPSLNDNIKTAAGAFKTETAIEAVRNADSEKRKRVKSQVTAHRVKKPKLEKT